MTRSQMIGQFVDTMIVASKSNFWKLFWPTLKFCVVQSKQQVCHNVPNKCQCKQVKMAESPFHLVLFIFFLFLTFTAFMNGRNIT